LNLRFHSEVLGKVKKSIQHLVQSGQHRHNSDYLVVMNIPPLMGRRDAAYDHSEKILLQNLTGFNEHERKDAYLQAIHTLETAIYDTQKIVSALYHDNKSGKEANFLRFLFVLKNTVQAASELVEHELVLFNMGDKLNEFIGGDISGQLHKTDEIFSQSENNIAKCVTQLISISSGQIKHYRDYTRRSFSRRDLERYEKSFNAFSLTYTK
jgi:hypothetical protein